MIKEKLTPKALQILALARKEAQGLKNPCAGTEHLLLGLLDSPTKTIHAVLIKYGVNIKALKKAVLDVIGVGETKILSFESITFTPRATRVVNRAIQHAEKLSVAQAEVEHIFYTLLAEDDGMASSVLKTLGVEAKELVKEFKDYKPEVLTEVPGPAQSQEVVPIKHLNPVSTKRAKLDLKYLNVYAIDLTTLAAENKLPKLIGRDKELSLIIETLCRKRKNNPILIGSAGTGKTAIVEGLAQRIINDSNIPARLKRKHVCTLDIASLIAGTTLRGQFEQRVKGVLNDCKAHGDIILFIDEAHQVVGAGSNDKVCDLGNLLKPSLARSELTCIAATTLEEYRASIEKDTALERRFQTIFIEIPSLEDTIQILDGIKSEYETHHKVQYHAETIPAIARLTDRFMSNLQFPDKAITIMDAVGARKRIRCDNDPMHPTIISVEDVRSIVSDITGIPDFKLKDGFVLVSSLEKYLHTNVIGQDTSVATVTDALKRAYAELRDEKRPIGCFLFLGPTGVGKSHFGKKLAEHLFESEKNFLKIDMSEYAESHTASLMIGSPPGYVGYDRGGKLTEFVKRKPYSVVLFDEIEKAHENARQILLQIMEDGCLTDRTGKTIDFKNTIIILTSNVGAQTLQSKNSPIGFIPGKNETNNSRAFDEVKKVFTPEFVNRIDEVLYFNSLSKENAADVLLLFLAAYKQRLLINHKTKITIDSVVVDFLVQKGFSTEFGARDLRRAIQREFESPLSTFLLENQTKYLELHATLHENKVVISGMEIL